VLFLEALLHALRQAVTFLEQEAGEDLQTRVLLGDLRRSRTVWL
jgi:hypothetical protein